MISHRDLCDEVIKAGRRGNFSTYTIVLVILAISPVSRVFADQPQPHYRFGFFGALNGVNLEGDADRFGDNLAVGLGQAVGGTWSSLKQARQTGGMGVYLFKRAPAYTAVFELQYVERGTEFDFDDTQSPGSPELVEKLLLRYIEFTPYARISAPPGHRFEPFGLLGAGVGIRVTSTVVAEVGAASLRQSIKNDTTGFILGGVIGAGLEAALSRRASIIAQLRYFHGLTDLLTDSEYSMYARDVSFLVGLEFEGMR